MIGSGIFRSWRPALTLYPFLCFSVLFSALVMIVVGRDGRGSKVVPGILIVVEVLLLLHHEGTLEVPYGASDYFRNVGSATVAIAATIDLMRQSEKTFSLLAVFAGLHRQPHSYMRRCL